MKLKITSITTICICVCMTTLSYGQTRKIGKFNLPEQIKAKKETTKPNQKTLDHHHLFVSNTNSNKRNVNLLPTKGYQLTKDNVFSSNWDYVQNLTHTRDNEGKIIKTIYLDTVSNFGEVISLYTYNSNGKETSHTNLNNYQDFKDSVMYHPIYTNFKTFEMRYEESGSNNWQMVFGTRTNLVISAGKIQSKITEWYTSNGWKLKRKSIYKYNSIGQLIEEVEASYWILVTDSFLTKNTYEYNSTGNSIKMLSEEWDEDEQEWIKLYKVEIILNKAINNFEDYFILESKYLFDDNIVDKYNFYIYENETWQLLYLGEIYYDGENYEAIYNEYGSNDDTIRSKEIFEKIGNKEISTSLEYDNDLEEFVYTYRSTDIIDPETNEYISEKSENWDNDAKEWKIDFWEETTKKFDTQGRLQSITSLEWFDGFEGLWEVGKTIYTYWGPIIPGNTSIKLLKSNQHTISLYPNPCSDILFVEIKDDAHQIKNVSIRDLTGKTILKHEFISNTHEINLELLNPGMYLIDILINNEFETHKFIKQ
ncbi:MAG: T9SS type A sorting domain-containing protein [Bacteroidota bacterium]|nr:T9SS type A sorting domain-containing protein [Bacteroidota bacterium]